MYTHPCVYIYTHAYTHTRIYTHSHTHTLAYNHRCDYKGCFCAHSSWLRAVMVLQTLRRPTNALYSNPLCTQKRPTSLQTDLFYCTTMLEFFPCAAAHQVPHIAPNFPGHERASKERERARAHERVVHHLRIAPNVPLTTERSGPRDRARVREQK